MDLQEDRLWQVRTAQRFWPKVDRAGARRLSRCPNLGPCWLWTAGHFGGPEGYGAFATPYGPKPSAVGAHRVAWELWHGCAVPAGHVVDHLCGVKACVNPRHLEAVTPGINVRRTVPFRDFALSHPARTSCGKGHALVGHNRMVKPDGRIRCRRCANERDRLRRHSKSTFARGSHKTECKHGHPWVPENIYVKPSTGHRECRLCMTVRPRPNVDVLTDAR